MQICGRAARIQSGAGASVAGQSGNVFWHTTEWEQQLLLFCSQGRSALFGQNLLQGVTLIWQKGIYKHAYLPSVVNHDVNVFFGDLCLSFAALVPRPVKGLEVVCLDVGQGDGLLLRSGKRAVLIDGAAAARKNWGILCWSLI